MRASRRRPTASASTLYHVLEDDGAPIADSERIGEIERALWRSLQRPEDAPLAVSRRAPRQVRMFSTPTQIAISVDERNRRSVLELVAGDRPGLLCDVGKVLLEERVDLQAAKISTIGERAEDVFYITDLAQQPLDDAGARTQPAAARSSRRCSTRRGRPHESGISNACRVSVRAPGAAQGRHHAARAAARTSRMSIGEPKHAPPPFVLDALRAHLR